MKADLSLSIYFLLLPTYKNSSIPLINVHMGVSRRISDLQEVAKGHLELDGKGWRLGG